MRNASSGNIRIDFLAMRRVLDLCQAPFDGRLRRDMGAVRRSELNLTKGRLPFRKEMPEAFCSDALKFIHDRAAGHVEGCPAGKFRCRPCAHDRTSGSHAGTCR